MNILKGNSQPEMHDSWRIGQEISNLKRIADIDSYAVFDIRTMKFIIYVHEHGDKLLCRKEFLTSDATTICIWMRKVLNDYQSWK